MPEKVLVVCAAHRLWARSYVAGLRLAWDELLPILYLVHGDGKNINTVLLHKYNYARDLALVGGYDALFCLEDDVVPPPNTLKALCAVDADIVYGLYPERHGRNKWLTYTELTVNGGRSLSQDEAAARAAWGQVIDVAGVGMGCTLIRRSFLEALPFRLGEHGAPDWWLGIDAQRYGFTQKAHLGVRCGHLTDNGHAILYADIDAPGLVRKDRLHGQTTA